jgi:predicted transcriptional regulator
MEESTFIRLIGNSPLTKVLDFLLTSREFDYSKKEIAENSEISYNTLSSIWSQLITNEIIVKTRRIGKQDMFKLNTENGLVKELVHFYDALLKQSIEQHTKVIKQAASNK